jgi:hypothetical protein
MSYSIAKILTLDDEPLGWVVVKDGTTKLEDTNIWLADEGIEDHVAKLNDQALLAQFWPDARDPDVLELVTDENWEPLVYEETELIDEATDQVASMQALKDPSQPIQRFRKACEIVARRRASA